MSSNDPTGHVPNVEAYWTPGQQRALQDVRTKRPPGRRWMLLVSDMLYTLDDDGLRQGVPAGVDLMQGPMDVSTGKPTEEMVWMHNSVVQLKAYDLGPTSP